jgi:hypothetical protein
MSFARQLPFRSCRDFEANGEQEKCHHAQVGDAQPRVSSERVRLSRVARTSRSRCAVSSAHQHWVRVYRRLASESCLGALERRHVRCRDRNCFDTEFNQ